MFFEELDVLKRAPRKGIVGIDFRTVPRVKGARALEEAGRARVVVLLRV